jgi:hypothetical protein
MPFEKAVNQARKLLNANEQNPRYQAWEKGEIDENIKIAWRKSTVRISRVLFTTNGIS